MVKDGTGDLPVAGLILGQVLVHCIGAQPVVTFTSIE